MPATLVRTRAYACLLAAASVVTHPVVSGSAPGLLHAQEIVDLPAEDRPLASGSFEEVYRVAPDILLSSVAAGEFDGNGVLYLQDIAETARLLAVAADGGSVREVGGQGEGPGEFTLLTHFAVLADRRVAAFDGQHNAYQVFSTGGDFERMVKLGAEGGIVAAMANIGRRARGHRTEPALISLNAMSMEMSAAESGRASTKRGQAIERIGLAGDQAEIDTVLIAWSPPPGEDAEMNVGGFSMNIGGGLQVFEPETHYDVLPGGMIAVSDSSAYAIKVAGGDGRIVRVLRRPFAPLEVTGDMRDAAKEAFRQELEEDENFVAMQARLGPFMEQQIEQMRFYHEVPVVTELKAGWERAIWVMRSGEEPWDEDAPGPIDVLTTAGEYLGTFAQDAMAMPLALGPDGLAAFVEVDAFDVPTVVVKRLPEELR